MEWTFLLLVCSLNFSEFCVCKKSWMKNLCSKRTFVRPFRQQSSLTNCLPLQWSGSRHVTSVQRSSAWSNVLLESYENPCLSYLWTWVWWCGWMGAWAHTSLSRDVCSMHVAILCHPVTQSSYPQAYRSGESKTCGGAACSEHVQGEVPWPWLTTCWVLIVPRATLHSNQNLLQTCRKMAFRKHLWPKTQSCPFLCHFTELANHLHWRWRHRRTASTPDAVPSQASLTHH